MRPRSSRSTGRAAAPPIVALARCSRTRRRSVRIRAAAKETACESSSTVTASQTPPEAPGTSLAGNDRGQVAQRVVEMVCRKRRELKVLAGNRPYRRPVIGERDLRLARTELGQVVTPDPAAEL